MVNIRKCGKSVVKKGISVANKGRRVYWLKRVTPVVNKRKR